ncbi:MAG TPA: OB-fold domain-containing protein [Candidatus Binatia bacterium]|nr:OB-fold domain-containing protein [Candidatus Binatia bacterium]
MTSRMPTTEPMSARMTVQFPYKHSTGEVTGRFLAGLKEQKKIWGRRVSRQGVVVPPNSYSEVDAKDGGEWVEVKDEGTVTAVAEVRHPVEHLHPSDQPFAFLLVKLDAADTALAHIATRDLDRIEVGSRVKAVWAPDDQRTGTIKDILRFDLVG